MHMLFDPRATIFGSMIHQSHTIESVVYHYILAYPIQRDEAQNPDIFHTHNLCCPDSVSSSTNRQTVTSPSLVQGSGVKGRTNFLLTFINRLSKIKCVTSLYGLRRLKCKISVTVA